MSSPRRGVGPDGGPPAEGSFVVGGSAAMVIFADGFESGDASGWGVVSD